MAYEERPASGENISLVFQDMQNELNNLKKLIGRFVYLQGDAFIERSTVDFGGVIGEGVRPGFSVITSRSVTSGVPGTVCNKQIVVDGTAILRNMTLICDGNVPAVLVRETGHAILQGCHIVKNTGVSGAADSYVSVEKGGQLNVVACMFHGEQSAGFVVSNPAPAAVTDVDITGCVNLTSRPHDNVTTVGEVP